MNTCKSQLKVVIALLSASSNLSMVSACRLLSCAFCFNCKPEIIFLSKFLTKSDFQVEVGAGYYDHCNCLRSSKDK